MCDNNNTSNCTNCIADVLDIILKLQKRSCCQGLEALEGCDKPFLGPTYSIESYNTRPITLYRCCDGEAWTFPYTINGTSGETSIFRVENLDGCCCTVRLLAPNPDTTSQFPFVGTDNFVTLNLECVGALTCLADTCISNCG